MSHHDRAAVEASGASTHMHSGASEDPLGVLVTTRKSYPIAALFMFVLMATGVVLLLFGADKFSMRVTHPQASSDMMTYFVTGLMNLAGAGALMPFSWRRTFEFRTNGARMLQRGKLRRELAYADVIRMQFAVTRTYVNGVYAGTQLSVNLIGAKTAIRYSGRYKESATFAGSTIFHKKFKSADNEAELLRMVIANSVADAYAARMETQGSVNWSKVATLSPAGLTPRSGKRKGVCVSFDQIVGSSMQHGFFHLFASGDKRSFADFSVNEADFWPCLALFERLHEVATQPEATEGSEAQRDQVAA
jgi:hypothetical protein